MDDEERDEKKAVAERLKEESDIDTQGFYLGPAFTEWLGSSGITSGYNPTEDRELLDDMLETIEKLTVCSLWRI